MQEISIEIEQGSLSPLDFLFRLKEWLRDRKLEGEINGYSIAIPTGETTIDQILEVIDASSMHDKIFLASKEAPQFTCPDCGSSSYIEDPDTPSKLTCKQCGKVYDKPV